MLILLWFKTEPKQVFTCYQQQELGYLQGSIALRRISSRLLVCSSEWNITLCLKMEKQTTSVKLLPRSPQGPVVGGG